MPQVKYAPSVYVALAETGLNNVQIAEQLGVGEASVRRGLKAANWQPYVIPSSVISKLRADLEQPIRIDVQKHGAGAPTADWHHPLTDYPLVNRFISAARSEKATNWLAVIGDWWNMDSLSQFDHKQQSAGLEQEMFGSTQTMTRLLDTFERIFFTWGNHDSRFHKALGYRMPFARAMQALFTDLTPKQLARITFTNLDHLWIDTPRGPYYACHPKAYSSVPLTQARRIASKVHAHTLTAHSHHTAVGYDVSGRFVCAELGGFFDKDQVEYLQRSTAFPNWQQGYCLIDQRGNLSVRTEDWTT